MLIRLDKRLLASRVAFEVPGGVLLIVTDPTGEQVADRQWLRTSQRHRRLKGHSPNITVSHCWPPPR